MMSMGTVASNGGQGGPLTTSDDTINTTSSNLLDQSISST